MNDQQIYYETMYILRPDIAEDEVINHIEKYNKLLKKVGGKVLDSQMRGKRRLAYQIAKHREGIYVQLSHQGDGQHIFKIEKAMRLSEDVIRYMTVKQNGPLPTPKQSLKNTPKSEGKAPEDKLTKDKAPEDKVTKDKAPEDKLTKDKAPEDKVTKDKAPENKSTKDKAPEDKSSEENNIKGSSKKGSNAVNDNKNDAALKA